MGHIAILLTIVGGAVLAALAASIGLASTAHLSARRGHGYMHLVFYAMLMMSAVFTLASGRDMSSLVEYTAGAVPRHPVVALLQPMVSLFILTVTGERILSHWFTPQSETRVPKLLLTAFIVFWLGTVAAPAVFGAHPLFSHDFVYPVVIGIAMLLASGEERDMAFRAARNALLLYMAAGLLLIPVMPGLVLDTGYTQGLLPGVPRLAGLSAHPVSMGLLSQLGLLCLLAWPFERRWLNRLAWVMGLAVLFLAQSKTAWASFAVCSAFMVGTRRGPAFLRQASDPMRKEFGVLMVLAFIGVVMLVMGGLIFGELGGRLHAFFNTAEGAQLSSLTGRDQIWAIAYEEWLRNPVFGYGASLWDADYRRAIGMPNATHGHNQFMDSLARSGTVGAAALVFYALVLLVMSVRYNRQTQGFTLALFVALLLRSVSEVPLLLFGYGADIIGPMLLLMALASAASTRVAATTRRSPASAVYPAHRSSPHRLPDRPTLRPHSGSGSGAASFPRAAGSGPRIAGTARKTFNPAGVRP